MKKVVWALLALSALTAGILIVSCGETDPALAPAGAVIDIVGEGQTKWDYSCNFKVPYPCLEELETYLIALCIVRDLPGLGGGADTEASCKGGYWKELLLDDSALVAFRNEIALEVGSCGALNNIITAFVYLPGLAGATTGASGENAGTALTGTVLNDVEVRFVAVNGDMYLLSDISGESDPLPNPYLDRTDDRGKAEIKYLTQFPTVCESTYTYILYADIGVSKTSITVDFSVAAEAEEEEETDDDDSAE